MWPMLAVAAATAAAQYFNNQSNQSANSKLAKQNRERLDAIGLPEMSNEYLDPNQLHYNDYTYGGDYDPTSGQFVREVDPTTVQHTAAANYGRDAQMEALKKFQQNIQSGYDPELAAKINQANDSSQANAQSRSASVLQDAERRGQLGTNAMLARQLQGSSDAMSQGSANSQAAAVAAYQNLLGQQMNASTMGRQLASDEDQFSSNNANIINSFNQRTSKAYQQYLDQQNDMQNQAQLRNLNSQQNISNMNVNLGNQQTQDQYNAARQERAYKDQTAQSNFNNQMTKATGQTTNNNQLMDMNNKGAQSTAQMYQGVGNSVAGYYSQQDANEQRALDRASNERAAQYAVRPPQQTNFVDSQNDPYSDKYYA